MLNRTLIVRVTLHLYGLPHKSGQSFLSIYYSLSRAMYNVFFYLFVYHFSTTTIYSVSWSNKGIQLLEHFQNTCLLFYFLNPREIHHNSKHLEEFCELGLRQLWIGSLIAKTDIASIYLTYILRSQHHTSRYTISIVTHSAKHCSHILPSLEEEAKRERSILV